MRGVLGHSFGGKVALELVRGGAAAAVLETLWVATLRPKRERLEEAPGPCWRL